MGRPSWTDNPIFESLESRYANQDQLDRFIGEWTCQYERYDLMARLQNAGVPAGVCQDTRDRYERDAQLKHRGYFVNVKHSEVPDYDVEGHPGIFSDADPSPLGSTRWGAACYAEHNSYIYEDLLGLSTNEVADLTVKDAI